MRVPYGAVLLLMIAGFAIWSLAFIALYGVLTIGCALSWNDMVLGLSMHRLTLLTIWVGHLAAIALLAWGTATIVLHRLEAGAVSAFLLPATWWSTLAALGATAWIGIPIFMTSTCV